MFQNNLSCFITLNKISGYSSAYELNKLKKTLGIKKAGFCGTLDPIAKGILVVACGRATKLISMITDFDKVYSGTMKLGFTSPSFDTDSELTPTGTDINISEKDLNVIEKQFTGTIKQTPPVYSALKINGKRACDIARKGGNPEIKEREITISSIKINKLNETELSFIIKCSKGTYIRSIASDIGKTLGCGAVLQSLTRESVGSFTIENSVTIEELKKNIESVEKAVTTIDRFLADTNAVDIDLAAYEYLRDGKEIATSGVELSEGMNYIRFENSPAFLLKKAGNYYSYVAFLRQ